MMNPPEDFPFPFEPYDIQKTFMKDLYNALEGGKLGIFESPTGTGKSLSLCCGAIQWLKDHTINEQSQIEQQIETLKNETTSNDDDGNDWLKSDYEKIKKNSEILQLKKKLDLINIHTEKINKIRSRKILKQLDVNIIKNKHKFTTKKSDIAIENIEENQLPIEDDHDLLLDEKVDELNDSDDNEENNDDKNNFTKIYFCSRTHSQLSQFVNEIKRTSHNSDVSVVSLASRQQYCINASVQRLKTQSLINEQCLDLQRGNKSKVTAKAKDGKVTKRSKTASCCTFFNQNNIETLKDDILVDIMDVEDLVNASKSIKACPYYSARAAVKESQIIVVPYQTLLHKATRCANGISLKNNIVIIDEAHNLLETIGHIYSAEIYGSQLQIALCKLKQYRDKYNARFAAKNLLNLNQIIYIVGKILGMLKQNSTETSSSIYSLEDFVLKAEIDNYNLSPLLHFCVQSKLAQKLHGFSEKYTKEDLEESVDKKVGLQDFLSQISKNQSKNKSETNQNNVEPEKEKRVSVGNVIQSFVSFLETLTSTYQDGRILTYKNPNIETSYLKFLLLNPATQFTDIVNEARSVIVAGGTMQPFSEFRDQLFISSGASNERIVEFSCGHVIPPEHILPICLSEGPSGKALNFTYESRKSPEMLNEIGRILLNLCNIVPGGIVCFFPSYDYEKVVFNHLSMSGMIKKIEMKKKVFREPKTTGQVDKILDDYSKVIHNSKNSTNITGALMLSVVGGKLSEGLNFSDDLGRCVLVIGMPYPNMKSAELQEKMKYLNENVSKTAGNIHYENLCIKAVNQCIGRAVRHAKDYATVILMDERYSRDHICAALPKWIQISLIPKSKFGPAFGSIRKFFNLHKSK